MSGRLTGRHHHALLQSGLTELERALPGLAEQLLADGALRIDPTHAMTAAPSSG
ncbi:MAG: hypothetical protein ACRDU8_03485 [Egibacteraceae bacterium]